MTAKTLAEMLRVRAEIWDEQVDTVVQKHVLVRHVALLRQAADALDASQGYIDTHPLYVSCNARLSSALERAEAAESLAARYRGALEWISNTHAVGYEYQEKAESALKGDGDTKLETLSYAAFRVIQAFDSGDMLDGWIADLRKARAALKGDGDV